jgi:hypothetical protein
MTKTEWFALLLAATVVLRGLGAGAILGVLVITLPTRRRIGVVAYSQFTRAHYDGAGVRGYGALTVLGAVMTAVVFALAIAWGASSFVTWSLIVSLVATMLGFVGTARALPAMRDLKALADDEPAKLATHLDRFAKWGSMSAGSHIVAFVAIVTAGAALAS